MCGWSVCDSTRGAHANSSVGKKRNNNSINVKHITRHHRLRLLPYAGHYIYNCMYTYGSFIYTICADTRGDSYNNNKYPPINTTTHSPGVSVLCVYYNCAQGGSAFVVREINQLAHIAHHNIVPE